MRSFTDKPEPARPRRVCMLAYSHYDSDNRVMRYARTLAERGDSVDVVSLRQSPEMPRIETIAGVRIIRLQDRFGKRERSQSSFLLPLLRFFLSSTLWITREQVRRPYDCVHVHNVPDFLVFAALCPKLAGVKVILDVHDIIPEFYCSKFRASSSGATAKLLRLMERSSARFADHVIISNHLWRDKYVARTGTEKRCSVFINNVDRQVFRPVKRIRTDGKLVVLFPGGLQWHQGLDIALQAFREVKRQIPQSEFHIYGDGNMKSVLVEMASDLGLNGGVRFFDPVPICEIARIMAEADLGVVPKRADSFGNEAYSTKIMEFMSAGVPVVVSDTKIDRYYFDDSVVKFFKSGDPDALADAMLGMLGDRELRLRMATKASEYAARNSWETRKAEYLQLVDAFYSRN